MIAPLHNASQVEFVSRNMDKIAREIKALKDVAARVLEDEATHPETALEAARMFNTLSDASWAFFVHSVDDQEV